MSKLFTIALQQTKKKSWWDEIIISTKSNRGAKTAHYERMAAYRKETLNVLKMSKKPMSFADLEESTGISIKMLRGVNQVLYTEGLINRVTIDGKICLEAM